MITLWTYVVSIWRLAVNWILFNTLFSTKPLRHVEVYSDIMLLLSMICNNNVKFHFEDELRCFATYGTGAKLHKLGFFGTYVPILKDICIQQTML